MFCGRHFANLLDIPRCKACDEVCNEVSTRAVKDIEAQIVSQPWGPP